MAQNGQDVPRPQDVCTSSADVSKHLSFSKGHHAESSLSEGPHRRLELARVRCVRRRLQLQRGLHPERVSPICRGLLGEDPASARRRHEPHRELDRGDEGRRRGPSGSRGIVPQGEGEFVETDEKVGFICFLGGKASLPPPAPLPICLCLSVLTSLFRTSTLHSYIFDSPYETGSYNLRVVRKVWFRVDILIRNSS